VTPASESAADEAVADMVKANLKTLQLDRITRELLDADAEGLRRRRGDVGASARATARRIVALA